MRWRPAGVGVAHRLERGEVTAEENLAIALNREGGDAVVGIRIEIGINRAVCVQPGDPVPGRGRGICSGMNTGETTPDDELAVHVRGERQHDAVRAGIERGVE